MPPVSLVNWWEIETKELKLHSLVSPTELWKSKETDDSGSRSSWYSHKFIWVVISWVDFAISLTLERFTLYLREIICESVRYMHMCMHRYIHKNIYACFYINYHTEANIHTYIYTSLNSFTDPNTEFKNSWGYLYRKISINCPSFFVLLSTQTWATPFPWRFSFLSHVIYFCGMHSAC